MVGNPRGYDPDMAAGPIQKASGGVVFGLQKDARRCVADGFLPPDWFEERKLPGAVYAVILNAPIERCSVPAPEWATGARRLLVSVPIEEKL